MRTRKPGRKLVMISVSQVLGHVVPNVEYASKAGMIPPRRIPRIPVTMRTLRRVLGFDAQTNQRIIKMKPRKALISIDTVVIAARVKRGSPGVKMAPRRRRMNRMKPKKAFARR